MKDQKFFGTILIIAFFACVSTAWRASWKSARMITPLINQAAEEDLAFSPAKLNVKPLFEATKAAAPKKPQAPAWGSFKVAGQPAAGQPISLKTDFAANKAKIAQANAKKALDEKNKKKTEDKKKPAQTAAKIASQPVKPAAPSKSGNDSMKPIDDKGSGTQTIIAGPPVAPPPAQDNTKKAPGKRTAKEWELYITENSSQLKSRTQEFISAYQSGQLESDDEPGTTPVWVYSMIQALFDHSDVQVQDAALRISKEITTSESFAVVVHNSDRVDHSMRPKLTTEYMSYKELKKVRFLNRAIFNPDRIVQIQALNVLAVSVRDYLLSQPKQTRLAQNQTSQSSTANVEAVFEPFVVPLRKLASDSKEDPEVIARAAELVRVLEPRLNAPQNQFGNNLQTPPN